MKLLQFICFLLISLFSSLAMAEDIKHSRAEMVAFLKTLEGKIEPSFLNSCASTIEDVRITNCGKMHSTVLTDYMTSVVQLNRLRTQVSTYLKRPAIQASSSKKKTVQKIQTVLICMHKKYSDINIMCDAKCNPKTLAYTYLERNKDIQLCSPYFNLKKVNRAATLLHELAHECGAKDWDYLYDKNKAIRKPTSLVGNKLQKMGSRAGLPWFLGGAHNASANAADNFRYWALKGFCLPGHDC